MNYLDKYFGGTVSLFLQGMAGDSKAYIDGDWSGDWDKMDKCGRLVADDVVRGMSKGLVQVQPQLASNILKTYWHLQPVKKSNFETVMEETESDIDNDPVGAGTRFRWAKNQLKLFERGRLPNKASILAHGIKIADGLRIFALEGEPLAPWGYIIREFYEGKNSNNSNGITFPLGYSNGQGLYLPVSWQIPEGSYEVHSYWEYGYPAPLAQGMEEVVADALLKLRKQGIS